ncbi:hypothetical protein Y1Q_0001805 [Alligator mississippiensis]|uniref:Uncharacterized protein n=1 Tax=Alligator mississippiensis TaxID=8496 RepID=A0A151MKY1_ALLMI|nr:hypothetical protein Y1Q_0001805 [Alligator mississippiensis]
MSDTCNGTPDTGRTAGSMMEAMDTQAPTDWQQAHNLMLRLLEGQQARLEEMIDKGDEVPLLVVGRSVFPSLFLRGVSPFPHSSAVKTSGQEMLFDDVSTRGCYLQSLIQHT